MPNCTKFVTHTVDDKSKPLASFKEKSLFWVRDKQAICITQFKLIVGLIIVPYPRQLDEIFAANWVSRRALSLPRLDTPRKDDFALFKLAEILQHVTN